ncbi:Alpha-galactosidase [Calidithermus terrae]|uniref:Alpha-galactosidase n=1 Tax=Calidithermus terrae TaxID=1408545 RepID=A0A399ETX5_9DEIN|nr:glycoside hydrolase family 36 protein [Calidithermus terrae]RIH87438.1 Alpha-galactosidase [Calidithermus terrae]
MRPLLEDHTLSLRSPHLALRRCYPVVNGTTHYVEPTHVREGAHGLSLEYALPEGRFGLEARIQGDRCRVSYRLEGSPADLVLDSFGLHFARLEGVRAALRQGYHSWDGAEYAGLEAAPQPRTGYALTQLLPREGPGSAVLGFERHDRFQHRFTLAPGGLTVETLWDRKAPGPGGRCEAETLLAFAHAGVEEALREWARAVAQAADPPPRLPSGPITGWCSWYNLYGSISEENLLEHLQGAAGVAGREGLPMRVFQIDDGFTPEMGDWLEVRPQFPRGMKALLDDVRAAGFVPGLWIAPFVVGNRSRLYRLHPDWVVRDRHTGGPLVQMRFYGEFRWHKRSEEYYVLDATHPEALEYLRRVFRTWRQEWGCAYFKTDFMFFGMEHGPDRALHHTPGLTRVEIWRRVARMIRQEIGEALWVGCGAPLWPSVGLVDGIRTGRDVGAEWPPDARERLHGLALRNFGNHLLWEADPDCVLLRERFHHLSPLEQESLARFAAMMGGVMLTSDALDELSPARLELWRQCLEAAPGGCRFPLLGTGDPVLVQVRGDPARGAAVFLFNPTGEPAARRYTLADLGLEPPLFALDPAKGPLEQGPLEALTLELPPHQGTLLFLSHERLEHAPERLP